MSTYELDDELVRHIATTVWSSHVDLQALADQLREQLPIPAPRRIGAVVRTEKGVLIRVSPDGGSNCEWWLMGEGETIVDQGKQWVETANLGRITEVLSEGVDL